MGAAGLGHEAPLTEERIRAFFGIPVPEYNRLQLDAYLRHCGDVAPGFRWTDPRNLHLTVRFVGSVERATVEAIASRVSGPAFDVALGQIGTFKRGRLARVVWMGVSDGVAPLSDLASRVEVECRAAGLEPETRAYTAHLTLARAKARDGAALPQLPPLPALEPWRARELILYSSHLGRGGAVHEPITVVRLGE